MRNKRFSLIMLIVVLSVMLITTACGTSGDNGKDSADGGKKFIMRISTATAGDHPNNVVVREFKKRLEEKEGDRITVEHYPSNQLGTAAQIMSGVQDGSVQGMIMPSGYFGSLAPAINVLDLPFMFKDADEAYNILHKGTKLDDYLMEKGLVPMPWLPSMDRVILSKNPIESIEDLKGKKVWCFPNIVAQEEIKSYGGTPVNLDPGDLAVAVQQGTIDGLNTDPTFYNTQKFYVSAPHLITAPKGTVINVMMASKVWLETLPEDLQESIKEIAKEVSDEVAVDYYRDYQVESIEDMIENGLKFNEASEELLSDMKKGADSVNERFFQNVPEAKEIYEEIKMLILD
ncbi:MAG TPA: TRAP transporter substrate-binding protein [Thermoanaerobacterales bacterium]|nr:TRAP transporter substrate-binding protein [Thermoanaerobacterales bacterium]